MSLRFWAALAVSVLLAGLAAPLLGFLSGPTVDSGDFAAEFSESRLTIWPTKTKEDTSSDGWKK